jgi:hypothetical protein
MTDRDGRVWGVIPVRAEDKKSFCEEFEIKDDLSIYEAAMIASGRHPWPRIVGAADIGFYWDFLTAGIKGKGRQRVRAQRSVDMFYALMDAIKRDKPTTLVYLLNGDIDWRFTRIKTEDVVKLAEEKGWRLKFLRPLIATLEAVPGASAKAEHESDGCAVDKAVLKLEPLKPFPAKRESELKSYLVGHARKQKDAGAQNNENIARQAAEEHFEAKISRDLVRSLRKEAGCLGAPGRRRNHADNRAKK